MRITDLDDSKERLIEAAVRPFSDNAELRHSAADFLGKRITANDDTAAAMLERWNEVDARKRKSFWRIGLWVVVAVVSAGLVISDFDDKLPPDFLETARRIDPTNAWFTYLAAAVEARDAVKSKSRKSKRVERLRIQSRRPNAQRTPRNARIRAVSGFQNQDFPCQVRADSLFPASLFKPPYSPTKIRRDSMR